eukprot:Sdes_comp15129_c0_seq1m3938
MSLQEGYDEELKRKNQLISLRTDLKTTNESLVALTSQVTTLKEELSRDRKMKRRSSIQQTLDAFQNNHQLNCSSPGHSHSEKNISSGSLRLPVMSAFEPNLTSSSIPSPRVGDSLPAHNPDWKSEKIPSNDIPHSGSSPLGKASFPGSLGLNSIPSFHDSTFNDHNVNYTQRQGDVQRLNSAVEGIVYKMLKPDS